MESVRSKIYWKIYWLREFNPSFVCRSQEMVGMLNYIVSLTHLGL